MEHLSNGIEAGTMIPRSGSFGKETHTVVAAATVPGFEPLDSPRCFAITLCDGKLNVGRIDFSESRNLRFTPDRIALTPEAARAAFEYRVNAATATLSDTMGRRRRADAKPGKVSTFRELATVS